MKIDEHLEEILKLARPLLTQADRERVLPLIASHFRSAIADAATAGARVVAPFLETFEPLGDGTIQFYPDELDYVNAQLHPAQKCGHFLESFFQSCLRADAENYQLLRPILREFMAKYPASPERLEAERRDRGASA